MRGYWMDTKEDTNSFLHHSIGRYTMDRLAICPNCGSENVKRRINDERLLEVVQEFGYELDELPSKT